MSGESLSRRAASPVVIRSSGRGSRVFVILGSGKLENSLRSVPDCARCVKMTLNRKTALGDSAGARAGPSLLSFIMPRAE